MTREYLMATRDSALMSVLHAMPGNNGTPATAEMRTDFVAMMVMIHGACCKQLDSLRDHDGIACNATDLLGIAARIEKALPLTEVWANVIRAELGRIRKMAFEPATKPAPDPKI